MKAGRLRTVRFLHQATKAACSRASSSTFVSAYDQGGRRGMLTDGSTPCGHGGTTCSRLALVGVGPGRAGLQLLQRTAAK